MATARDPLWSRLAVPAVFFALFYLYVWLRFDTRLLYEGHGIILGEGRQVFLPLFVRGSAFLAEFLAYPGGLADYAAAFLSQYFHYAWVGGLVLAGLACGVYVLTCGVLASLGAVGRVVRLLAFVPPLLLLVFYNRCTFLLGDVLSLVVALAVAQVYVAVRPRWLAARLPIVAALSAALYHAVGIEYALFAVLAAVAEVPAGRWGWAWALACLAACAAPSVAAWGLLDVALSWDNVSLRTTLPYRPAVVTWVFLAACGSVAALAIFQAVWVLVVAAPVPQPDGAPKAKGGGVLAWAMVPLVLVGAAVSYFTRDGQGRALLRTNYYARTGQWSRVIEAAGRVHKSRYNARVLCDVNRALFETGRLGSEMFSYPQDPGGLLMLGEYAAGFRGYCETSYRLGFLNEAEHAACELLAFAGPRPGALRRLAMVNIVKGEPAAARVFLGALRKDVIHRRWAERMLRLLDEDPTLQSNEEVRYLRSAAVVKDWFYPERLHPGMFQRLLLRNGRNRMAYEYMLACFLLNRQLEPVVGNLGRLREFGYRTVPRHYAEAALLHVAATGQRPDLRGLAMPPDAIARFRKLRLLRTRHAGDFRAFQAALRKELPDSYFRYYILGPKEKSR